MGPERGNEPRTVPASMRSESWSAEEAFERAPAALAVLDASEGTVLRVNDALATRLGVDAAALEGLAWPSPLGGTRHDFRAIAEALDGSDTAVVESRLGDRIDPVWWRQVVSRVDGSDGAAPYLIVQVEDRSAEHRSRVELMRAADHDELTGLWNRRRFRREVRESLSRSKGGVVAVVLFDVDGFKDVNDTYGHAMGDAALSAVASVLRSAVPSGAQAARLSGDEFAVVLFAPTSDEALEACSRLVAGTSHVVVGEGAPEIDLSAGWAVGTPGPDPDRRVQDLLIEADVAMYANKERTRAERAASTVPAADEAAVAAVWPLETVQDTGLELWAHPVVLADGGEEALHDITMRGNGEPVTLGALVRMLEMIERHSRRGVGRPGRYLVHLPDFPLGVGSAVKWLGRTAADVGLPPGSVTFALPEQRLLDDASTRNVLASLREEGLGLAIDSFGGEVASLRLLADLAPDQVWFDHRLLDPAAASTPDAALDLVEVAVAMVQRLGGLTGIAGIEPGQVEAARKLGIDLVLLPDRSALRPVGVVALEGSIVPASGAATRRQAARSTTGS